MYTFLIFSYIPALLIVIDFYRHLKYESRVAETLPTAPTDEPFIYLLMVVGSLIYASGELMEL